MSEDNNTQVLVDTATRAAVPLLAADRAEAEFVRTAP